MASGLTAGRPRILFIEQEIWKLFLIACNVFSAVEASSVLLLYRNMIDIKFFKVPGAANGSDDWSGTDNTGFV